jgi:hypothetical protein
MLPHQWEQVINNFNAVAPDHAERIDPAKA